MGKYKSLISNMVIFGISTFSSKLLVFFLMPFYTRMLSPEDFGAAMLVTTTCNLILPVMYLSISEAVIRFGLDNSYKKSDIYTTGLLCVFGGYLTLWCLRPLLLKVGTLLNVGVINEYLNLVYLYVIASAFRTVTSHFVRSLGMVRLFALDGIFTSVMTIVFNIIFLLRFEMGIAGYVLATIAADSLSGICIFLLVKLHRFIKPRSLSRKTIGAMLRYSLPLIPTNIFWWITNASDQYFITAMVGIDVNGLYTAAARVPALITAVSAFFIQAWQISAFTEYRNKEGEAFYSTVFKSYYTFIFLSASGLILLARPITRIYVDSQYYESWRFMPLLILAVSFSCLVTFLGTIYNAAKRNTMITVTTALGAVANLVLNYVLIQKHGAQGAAFATFFSYMLVFLIRAVDTRKYMKIAMQPLRILMNLGLLLAQVRISLADIKYGMLWQTLIFFLLLAGNFNYLLFMVRKLMGQIYMRKHKRPQL